jgi:selenide,water dikinase
MKALAPVVQDLVLIGGGHSHAIALRKFGMNPIPGVRLTLITDVCDTPYSGMLPGYVAGLYSFDDCHIDLRPLTRLVGASMILDRAIGLDLAKNRVLCANHPPIAFDWLSIDIGSTPATLTIPGAAAHTIPVKPISKFLTYWDALVNDIAQQPKRPLCLAIVGGGAGGVELALSIQARLQRIYQTAQQPITHLELHLFHRGSRLLPNRSFWVGQRLQRLLGKRGIHLHLNETVVAVEAISEQPPQQRICCESGLTVTCDRTFWVTQASAAPWLQTSGLATDADGFILVSDTLQSISHSQVFATGDVATMVNHPRPKAGVFSVRQGKPLFDNLQRVLSGRSPKPFIPQKEFLILIGTGDEAAIASRGSFGCGPANWIWRWKDHIDRKFMNLFNQLKPMEDQGAGGSHQLIANRQPLTASMPCAGCGSKVGSLVLGRVLARIQQEFGVGEVREDVLMGLAAADDAAVVAVPPGQVMVQTVDYFRALVDDPFLLGQITTHHCLSDLFAMGAVPQSALAIATLADALDTKLEESLYQLLAGAMQVLQQAGAVLVGGHSTAGAELAFGLACNGLAYPDRLLRKRGMQPGQVLILTKPLGTGVLFAADMRLRAKGRWIQTAIQSMLLSNQAAAHWFQTFEAIACTDITGFGLLGHVLEMVQASQVAVELNLSALPILDGIPETLAQGIVSSLYPQNLQAAAAIANREEVAHHPLYPLLFDPQTSGGLLAAIPEEMAIACLNTLQANGYPQSAIIGQVLPHEREDKPVWIKC